MASSGFVAGAGKGHSDLWLHIVFTTRRIATGVTLFALLSMLATATVVGQEGTPPPGGAETAAPCQDGRLRIRDLADLDNGFSDELAELSTQATTWQQDARLVELRLACPLLTTGLDLEGTFFSETAQANFLTDTADIEPAEEAPEDVPFLDIDGEAFAEAYRSLLRAGFSEDLLLASASSVTVRLSTDLNSFGPPIAPRGVVYVHVAVEERGQIKDVWIDATDGTIYRYEMEG